MNNFYFRKIVFDIEVTTHCNATCAFCPREDVPFLQHMPLETLDKIIERLQELSFKPVITLCGTGDCSTHPKLHSDLTDQPQITR